MDSNVKVQWLNALRSGEYTQSDGALKNNNGYCCLGVLCDLYAKEHQDVKWKYLGDLDNPLPGDYFSLEEKHDFLPYSVREWAGLENENPYVELPVGEEQWEYGIGQETYPIELSELNDQGNTFNEIADLIEKQF